MSLANLLRRLEQGRRLFGDSRSFLIWIVDRVLLRLRMKIGRNYFPYVAQLNVVGFPEPIYIRTGTSNMLVLEEIILHNEYKALERFLNPNAALVVDLGANIGISARLWARQCPRATIVAVEPDEENAAFCRRNLSGVVSDFKIVVAFIGGRDGYAYLDRSGGEWAYRKTECPSSSNKVPVVSMASFLDRYVAPGADIDLLKIDIEGAEAEILPTIAEWLPRCRTVVLELHHEVCTPDHLAEALVRSGLDRTYDIDDCSSKGATSIAILTRREQLP